MLETLILLAVAAVLGLYAIYELAPRRYMAATLRRLGVIAPPTAPQQRRSPDAAAALPLAAAPGREPSVDLVTASETDQGATAVLYLWAPVAIVVLAFALRMINLTGVPYGFFCDEASPAIDAYSIAHTLHDQHGAFLPAYFEALGEWPGGFQTYWDVPFVVIFGLTEFASRIASVVAGTLTVWLTYIFVSKATNHRQIGLIAAFLLAISPWHIMESRVGWQVINLPLIMALCLVCLYIGLERPRWLPLALACGALGIYGYFPGRIFFPLFCAAWIAIYARFLVRNWRMSLLGLAAAIVILIPTALALVNGTAFARLNQFGGSPQPLAQKLATYWSNYLAHFSPDFLLYTSDWITRHFVRGFGLLYPVEVPFIIIGVLAMLWRRSSFDILCLLWLVIYPVAASLVGPPILTRSIPGEIVFHIAAAQGIYATLRGIAWLTRRTAVPAAYRRSVLPFAVVLFLVVGFSANGNFMTAYLRDYPLYSSGWDGWQWGPQKIVPYFEAHRHEYDRELWNAEANAPNELLLFYTTPDTGLCRQCGITNVADPNAVRADYLPTDRELWAVSPDSLQGSTLRLVPHQIVGHLTYPSGQVAYLFVATGPYIGQARST